MADAADALILDLLDWVAAAPRPYSEVMDRWRTSCPRLSIWEDAVEQRLVLLRRRDGEEPVVELTVSGAAALRAGRR